MPAPETGHLYSPEGCGFEMTFPEEPATMRQCPGGGRPCDLFQSYTKVYGLSSTVRVRAICKPLADAGDTYTPGVVKTIFAAIARREGLENISFNQKSEDGILRAVLSGTASEGLSDKIYINQLWAGPDSILTVEGDLSGDGTPEADALFAEIFKSVQTKTAPASDPKAE